MGRRGFLHFFAIAAAGMLSVGRASAARTPLTPEAVENMRRNWQALVPKGMAIPSATQIVNKSRDEWKRSLSPVTYDVLREEGTERPFSSPLNDEKRSGVFAC